MSFDIDTFWMIVGTILTVIFAGLMLIVYLAVIMLCGWGVEWVFDSFDIDIDRTLYWTGIALLILFCAFGKTTIKKEKD